MRKYAVNIVAIFKITRTIEQAGIVVNFSVGVCRVLTKSFDGERDEFENVATVDNIYASLVTGNV